MAVNEVQVGQDVVSLLGEPIIREACAQLWPIDCFLCGDPLGDAIPGLWAFELFDGVDVVLCHSRCVRPFGQPPDQAAGVSWRAATVEWHRGGVPMPIFILNPSAERIHLIWNDGRWKVQLYPLGTGPGVSSADSAPI